MSYPLADLLIQRYVGFLYYSSIIRKNLKNICPVALSNTVQKWLKRRCTLRYRPISCVANSYK